MTILFFILLSFFSSNRVHHHNDKWELPAGQIICLNLVYSLPFVNGTTGEVKNLTDSIKAFYFGNTIMYQIPYPFEKAVEGKIVSTEIRKYYFIYNKKEHTGCRYDKFRPARNNPLSLDSIFKLKSIFQINQFFSLFKENKLSLVSSEKDAASENLLEKYIPKSKEDITDPDTLCFYFDNRLKDIHFSLIRELDSLKQSKLFRIRFKFNPVTENKFNIAAREMLFEFKKEDIPNKKEISDLFEEFKKDCPYLKD